MKLTICKNFPVVLGVVLAAFAPLAQAANTSNPANTPRLEVLQNNVRHELRMLPYYSIFDDLQFRVDGRTVILSGAVTRPILKSDAANVIKRLEGVDRVVNNIEVLPLSPMDDRIRIAVARAVYGYGPLQRYSLGALPPIHILVKNGDVTLTGFVSNDMDRNLVSIRANGVPGVFSVTNQLRTDRG
jgi:hyperosmotically inducible periplasmic protein